MSPASGERIHYRTRGGPTQGWGNIFRLASFAEWCRRQGRGTGIFFAEGPADVVQYLNDCGFEVVHLGDGISVEAEAEVLAQHPRADFTFVEMLDVTPERQRLLRKHTKRLIVFDDLCDHTYAADLVICGQDLPSHANRALSAEGTEFLVGYDHFLSRPEFLPYVDREREHSAAIRRILVTFGGGRYDIAYRKTAMALARRGRDTETTFVLGFEGRDALREEIEAVLPTANIVGGVSNMEELLWSHDLVIGSAGYTKLEAAITRTPQIVMSVQWHQIPLASVFAARTGVVDVGYMSYVEPDQLLYAIDELESQDARRESAERARAVVDGRGFERVFSAAFGIPPQEESCIDHAA